jgi:hypothetical protein
VVEGVFCKHCLESSSSSSDSDEEQNITTLTKKPEDKVNELDMSELLKTEKLDTASTSPLLDQPVSEVQMEPTKTPLDLTETESISKWNIIWTLNWLNAKLMLKDWKRFILPAVFLFIWIAILVIISVTAPIQRICNDGR